MADYLTDSGFLIPLGMIAVCLIALFLQREGHLDKKGASKHRYVTPDNANPFIAVKEGGGRIIDATPTNTLALVATIQNKSRGTFPVNIADYRDIRIKSVDDACSLLTCGGKGREVQFFMPDAVGGVVEYIATQRTKEAQTIAEHHKLQSLQKDKIIKTLSSDVGQIVHESAKIRRTASGWSSENPFQRYWQTNRNKNNQPTPPMPQEQGGDGEY